jgi:trehalose utilization protein
VRGAKAHKGLPVHLLHRNPVTGKSTYYVETDDSYVIYTEQDVEPVLDFCVAKASEKPGAAFRHAAEIPLVFVDQAAVEGWLHDEKKWKQWLNDRDHYRFRTWEGRL